MARGYDEFYGRAADVAALGKVLSRRARARCELCSTRTSLKVIEVEPVLEDPDLDRAVMVCERCIAALKADRGIVHPEELHFLEEQVWSELLPVQLTAVRLLRQLASQGVDWAADTLDGLYLDPEVEALV